MQGKMYTFRIDGSIVETELTGPPELAVLQAAVEGFIEAVPYFTRYRNKLCVAFCNADGKIKGLPVNIMATFFWYSYNGAIVEAMQDQLVGPVVVVTGDAALMRAL